jgi:hypothetical protein
VSRGIVGHSVEAEEQEQLLENGLQRTGRGSVNLLKERVDGVKVAMGLP